MSTEVTSTISQAKEILEKVIHGGDTSINCFLHSSPGIGKSSIIRQLSAKHELPIVDLRLASIEPSDLCGIPYVFEGEQLFSVPKWFPMDPNSKGIIFLDELSNANISVQHAAYRLVLDREIQTDLKLPKGWFVIAAGNLREDKCGAKGIVPALSNRFSIHLKIETNLQDFTSYALQKGLDQRIVGFLNFRNDVLYQVPTNESIAFPTPRSWEEASKILQYDFGSGQLITVLSGCVGASAANDFLAYLKYYKDLPNFENIMTGKEKYKVPTKNLGLVFAVATSAMYAVMENYEDSKRLKNLNKIFEQLQDDCLIMIYKTLSQTKNIDMLNQVIEVCKSSYNKIEKYIK